MQAKNIGVEVKKQEVINIRQDRKWFFYKNHRR